MRRIAYACALAFAVAACGGKKSSTAETAEQLDAAPISEERQLRRRSNNVSPDSVKREVEIRQKQHEQKVDKALDL